jgi:hypothetical protein
MGAVFIADIELGRSCITSQWMMVRIIAFDILAGAVLVSLWYFWFVRLNRRKCLQVLQWIDEAFAGHGQIASVNWLSGSRFYVRLRLSPNIFRQTSLIVQLMPREMPIHWAVAKLRRRQETLTFEADLDCPPGFNLEVQNHRWCGRTRRRLPQDPKLWKLEHAGPFVLTTRNDWQREITTMMGALVASRECDCLSVSFRRTSPHFTATVPLESISPESEARGEFFDVLRELAAGSSASRF